MRLDRILLAVIALIFIVHALATTLSWYFIYPWIDIPMHIAGGLWVGLLFAYIFLERHPIIPPGIGFIPFMCLGLGFVVLVGVGWELYEYFSYVFVTRTVPFGASVAGVHFDTLKDLIDDLFGGFLAIILYLAARKARLLHGS